MYAEVISVKIDSCFQYYYVLLLLFRSGLKIGFLPWG